MDIAEQEKVLKGAENKLSELRDDENSIVKKIESLQSDLQNKRNDQVMQEKDVANQRSKLEELKAKVVRL